MKKFLLISSVILFIFSFALIVSPVYAQNGLVPKETGGGSCPVGQNCGNYSLNDFVTIAINLSQWILGITGSLALLMFIYGGTMFLISGGSQERVKQAKDIIFGAVIGLAIVFTSYIIIGFVFKATGADKTGTAWSKSDWFNK